MSTKASESFHVALLRGINVGGKNKLAMKELASMFVDAGCSDVTTYIQSGNVVFRTKPAVAASACAKVESAIRERYGYDVPIVVRTADALARAIRGNPYLAEAAGSTDALHLVFLREAPTPECVAKLDPARSAGDEFVVRDGEIYLRLPNGVGKSKLTNAYFDKTLATISTLRNWRTVETLLAMTQGQDRTSEGDR
jgi:uncharacterized protein (DUF1697 family)